MVPCIKPLQVFNLIKDEWEDERERRLPVLLTTAICRTKLGSRDTRPPISFLFISIVFIPPILNTGTTYKGGLKMRGDVMFIHIFSPCRTPPRLYEGSELNNNIPPPYLRSNSWAGLIERILGRALLLVVRNVSCIHIKIAMEELNQFKK